MNYKQTLQQAWRAFFVLRKHRSEPLWARLVIGCALTFVVALVLMLVSVLLMVHGSIAWWIVMGKDSLVLGLVAGCTMLALLRAFELLVPARWLEALAAMRDWRPIALVSVILMVGMALGARLGFILLGRMLNLDLWKKLSGIPMVQLRFLLFALLIVAVNWVWWRLRAQENALAQQAAESQLRILQAQIEPHFLFNTLANVQSLIVSDPPRAQLMLEVFTDYLRASLGQMRVNDSTLEAELETACNYLQVMQVRMGDRLSFSIEASAQARKARMLPLLLQPLVENAVHHGLEPKVEGGSVRVFATIHEGQLQVHIDDDGLGLEHARRPVRAGNGVAMANIRTRLQTRYGGEAALVLMPLAEGTRVLLSLPYRLTENENLRVT